MTADDWRARYIALEQRHQEAVALLRGWEEVFAKTMGDQCVAAAKVSEWLMREKRNESV